MRLVVGAGLLALCACEAGERPRAVERSAAPVRPAPLPADPVTTPEAAARAPDQAPDGGGLAPAASAGHSEPAQDTKPAPCSRKRRRGERSERCLDDIDQPIDPNEF
jgi:hypothetical protein